MNSSQQNPQCNQSPPPSTSQTEQSLNARSMQIIQQSAPKSLQIVALEAPDLNFVAATTQEQTTPREETHQPESEIADDQHTDRWGDIVQETKQDMEWHGGALEARNRPMEAITVIESDDGEGQLDAICQKEEGEISSEEILAINPTTSPTEPEIKELSQQELYLTEITPNDLRPDYANQDSASQSLASGPAPTQPKTKKHKKKRIKPGTDSKAGVVPPV